MANYYRVSPQFWRNSARAWDDDTRLLAFYLLTSPHRNLEGLYWLPFAYMQADLGWKPPRIRRALQTLIDHDFAYYDEANEVMFVKKALRFQAPATERQIKGAVTSLERLPHTPLLIALLSAADEFAPALANAIRIAFPNTEQSHG